MKIEHANMIDSTVFRDALEIRLTVFVEEQGVPVELERDEFDETATHFVGYVDGLPVTTLRIKQEGNQWHVQRVATSKQARHHGYASVLMESVIELAHQNNDIEKLILGAQLPAIPFYEQLNFKAFGPEFLDAGILHREMELRIK